MGEIGEVATSSSARGLGSKASTIRFAVFMARDCGGTGTTGSFGSGKVLERFLGKSLDGNECGAGFIANALGGEVGVRAPGRGLWGEELEGDCCCSELVRSRVGEGDTRGLTGAV